MERLIQGNICDPIARRIYGGKVYFADGKITKIIETSEQYDRYILPGLIDAHIHIESSMLVPLEFAKGAVSHGTVATVSDPHEIANVLGIRGIEFMINNGAQSPFKFYFGAPSCVPATNYESSGAIISAGDIDKLLSNPKIKYLSEMMNYPGVLSEVPDVIDKLNIAKKHNKVIDGHAPGLSGELAKKYIEHGISTDHECFTLEEALEKIKYGMKILIREGTAAKNFEALHSLLSLYPDKCMFCSDDKHPDDLLLGHINKIMASAIEKGHNFFDVLCAATLNPIKHYNLEVGLLQEGDYADFVIAENLSQFEILQTYIDGILVFDNGKILIESTAIEEINNFDCNLKSVDDFKVVAKNEVNINVIDALDGQLVTSKSKATLTPIDNNLVSDIERDILKIAVINRYTNNKPSIAFIRNFGLKYGAIASSVAHDSHNIIAIGTSDEELCRAVNTIIQSKGGLCATNGDTISMVELPIAGLMSKENIQETAHKYIEINKYTKAMGSKLYSPFMTASFMALLVIPSIKLSDKGLFNAEQFEFIDLIIN
ncbi:MAG TPA: adenine deaminase [Candidatus Kapabacteria bacterium]|nr:adenine deaminase [Candidatus Kapabacteria bacterium]